MTEIWRLGVGALRQAYDDRSVSPVEATDALIDRIDRLDLAVSAITTRTTERARRDAEALTAELAGGSDRGPLHGIPVVIKELFDVGGAETTYGAPMLVGRVPPEDAAAVRRLREAGCIVLGLSRSHEFGWGITTQNPILGSTRNPWALERVPGGSSGGSAAALAMGFAPLALGSDTGGSIRIPAAFCGVAGIKPTYGRIPKHGAVGLAPSLDHPGPLAREVSDLIPALAALAGHDPADPTTWLPPTPFEAGATGERLRFGLCPDLHLRALADDHQRLFEDTMARLGDVGDVVEVGFPGAGGIRDVFAAIQMAEAYDYHANVMGFLPERRSEYGADVGGRLDLGAQVPLADYMAAQRQAQVIRATFADLLSRVDVLVTPVSAGSPSTVASPDMVDHRGESLPFRDLVMDYTVPQDLAGLPAVGVPIGLDDLGLPVAAQVTAARGSESTAIRGALALEALVAPGVDWPALATD